jgi:hypothetical protein
MNAQQQTAKFVVTAAIDTLNDARISAWANVPRRRAIFVALAELILDRGEGASVFPLPEARDAVCREIVAVVQERGVRVSTCPLKAGVAVGALLLMPLGCVAPTEHYGDHYTVSLDPALPTAYQSDAVAAVESWEAITGNATRLDVSVGLPGDCSGIPDPGHVCVFASSTAEIAATGGPSDLAFTRRWTSDGSDTYLPLDRMAALTDVQVTTVMAHELGHAMGLMHTTPATSNVMYPEWDHVATLPTCNDYAQWSDLRGPESFATNPACLQGGSYALSGE